MANYAFRPRQLSNSGIRQNITGPGWQSGGLYHYMFDEDPEMAFNQWLKWLRPSTAQRGRLENLRNQFYNRYASDETLGVQGRGGVAGPSLSFIDYLTRLNPQREILSQSPYARGTESRRFRDPSTRWNAFG